MIRIVVSRRMNHYFHPMKHFTAVLHRGEPDEGGFLATCLEVPGANGQGETSEDCLENLASAVKLILDINREEAHAIDPNAQELDLCVA